MPAVGAGPFCAVNGISLGIKNNGGQRPVEVQVEEANWPEGGRILDPFMAPIRHCLTLLHYYTALLHGTALLLSTTTTLLLHSLALVCTARSVCVC